MALHVPFTAPHDATQPKQHAQGTLFDKLPRGFPVLKEEAEAGMLFQRLANRTALPPASLLH